MNVELTSQMEEILSIELSEVGISREVIDKVIESIKYNCKETNYLHNSVADSNFYAAKEREQKDREESIRKESAERIKSMQLEHEESERNLRRRIRDLTDEMERLNKSF